MSFPGSLHPIRFWAFPNNRYFQGKHELSLGPRRARDAERNLGVPRPEIPTVLPLPRKCPRRRPSGRSPRGSRARLRRARPVPLPRGLPPGVPGPRVRRHPAGPAPPTGRVPSERPRGASRPLREARDPPAGRTAEPPSRDRRLPGGARARVHRRALPGSAGFSAAPRAPSWQAERRAPPRPAPPRAVGHTQARASPLPTPRRAGPGRGRGRRREARGARHEARGTDGDALRARADPGARARAAWAGGAGSGQLLLPIFCLVSCQKKKNINSRAVSFSCRRGAWTPARTSE